MLEKISGNKKLYELFKEECQKLIKAEDIEIEAIAILLDNSMS